MILAEDGTLECIALRTGAHVFAERAADKDIAETRERLRVDFVGQGFTVRTYRAPALCWLFDMVWERVIPLSRCYLCADERRSAGLWDTVAVTEGIGAGVRPPARVPWLAVAALPAARTIGRSAPHALVHLAALEQRVAWARLTS